MNQRLKQSLSLAMLTLTLASVGAPVASALANSVTQSDQASTVTEKPATGGNNAGQSTGTPAPTTPEPIQPGKPGTNQGAGGSDAGSTGNGNTGSKPVPTPNPTPEPKPKPKPKPPIDPSKLPTSLPKTFDVPTEPAEGEPGARIKLSGATNTNNTRDLGGYVTADGKWKIKSNRLLRSANLSKFTPEDIKVLQKHNVKHIVDMRTKGQVSSGKDQNVPGATWENISILGQLANAGLNTNSSGDYVADQNKPGDAGFYNHQLEFSQSAVTGYHKFLTGLLTQNGATLFHCSSGKDRTGIGSVLIMSALGMDTATIAKDYMLSQTYHHTVRYSWLQEYYREINAYYKNMPNYLVQQLNFTPYQQEVLKSKYLVSNDKEERAYPAPKAPSTPAPSTPSVTKPETEKPVKPETAKPNHKPAAKHKRVKVVSVKKIKKAQMVHLKKHRAYFYDLHLKHKVGITKASKTKWRMIKRAKLQVNGKTVTYVQIVSPHGYHRWIQLNGVSHVKA